MAGPDLWSRYAPESPDLWNSDVLTTPRPWEAGSIQETAINQRLGLFGLAPTTGSETSCDHTQPRGYTEGAPIDEHSMSP